MDRYCVVAKSPRFLSNECDQRTFTHPPTSPAKFLLRFALDILSPMNDKTKAQPLEHRVNTPSFLPSTPTPILDAHNLTETSLSRFPPPWRTITRPNRRSPRNPHRRRRGRSRSRLRCQVSGTRIATRDKTPTTVRPQRKKNQTTHKKTQHSAAEFGPGTGGPGPAR